MNGKVANPSERHPQASRKEILQDVIVLGSTGYLGELINVFRGLVVASFLGPASYGFWNILKIFIYAAPYCGLGTGQAMIREVPLNIGRKQEHRNKAIIQTTFSLGFIFSSIIASGVMIWTFLPGVTHQPLEIRLAAAAFIGLYLLQLARQQLRSHNQILLLSRVNLFFVILSTGIGLPLLFPFRINGLLLGLIISETCLLLYLSAKRHIFFSFHIAPKILKQLMKTGIPIMILSASLFMMLRIDSLIIFFMLGTVKTGYYGLAAFLITAIHHIPLVISTVLLPKMMHRYGETNKREDIEVFFSKPIEILALLTPIILGLIYINIGLPINYLLPQFISAIEPIQVLTLSLFFSVIVSPPVNILIAFNKQHKLMVVLLGHLLLGGVLDYGIIKMGFDIKGVAVATGFTFFLASLFTTVYASITFRKDLRQIGNILLKLYAPFVYSLLVLWTLGFFLAEATNIYGHVIRTLAFLVLLIPVVLRLLPIMAQTNPSHPG